MLVTVHKGTWELINGCLLPSPTTIANLSIGWTLCHSDISDPTWQHAGMVKIPWTIIKYWCVHKMNWNISPQGFTYVLLNFIDYKLFVMHCTTCSSLWVFEVCEAHNQFSASFPDSSPVFWYVLYIATKSCVWKILEKANTLQLLVHS